MKRDDASLVILAGGASRRMGWPKHLLPTPYGRLIDYFVLRLGGLFSEIIVAGRELDLAVNGVRVVVDTRPEQSPLVGIHTGLSAAKTPLCFVLACDLPFAEPALVRFLLDSSSGADVTVPVVRSYFEPLFAVYRRSSLAVISETLDRGDLKVTASYDRLRVQEVPEDALRRFDADLCSFINLNAPEQLHLLKQL